MLKNYQYICIVINNNSVFKTKKKRIVYKYNKKTTDMATRTRILYERGVIAKIAKRVGVTEATVRLALRFATEGEQPDLIRQVAIKEYGCVLKSKPILLKNSNKE